jgi:hypothetical protein
MDFADPKFWLMAANFLLSGILALVVFARKPGEEAGKAINALADRVSRLEETLKHMPTNEELARLYGELRECNARVEHLVEGQRRNGNQFDRIEQFLMANK